MLKGSNNQVRNRSKNAKSDTIGRAKYPRQSLERALRIPRAILEQNAGKPCAPNKAAEYLGISSFRGPFGVEISSAIKYGFLDRADGKISPSDLARKILRPTSPDDEVNGYRTAVLNAPDISKVYEHYRGENLPEDEMFFKNTVVDGFHIPENDFDDFKNIFLENLEKAHLLQDHEGKKRVIDVLGEVNGSHDRSEKIEKLAANAAVKFGESCFVVQPFAAPHSSYYEKIFRPAIEKTGLQSVRADSEIFSTGKIMDQILRGIKDATILVAELTTRNANVFYELGIAHALKKPVVMISANEIDVPFDLRHVRIIYYDVTDPFWGVKLIDKIAENILSALKNPEEAILKF